ncbi:hypothetical protein SAMN05421811_122143 [Nonomuraea wenchangensis]|uniref:Uncharacterized protein n=1 Tax=Nonomuraea wenchangensis TaxID=568860 RepID=A0A1I0LQH6_9ACTN|nr:hypothetical protein SAMN05421811_122143 [Nonomuraea wenchangensis]
MNMDINVHVSDDRRTRRRGIRFTLNGVLWSLQALFGFLGKYERKGQ